MARAILITRTQAGYTDAVTPIYKTTLARREESIYAIAQRIAPDVSLNQNTLNLPPAYSLPKPSRIHPVRHSGGVSN